MESLRMLLFLLGLAALAPLPVSTQSTTTELGTPSTTIPPQETTMDSSTCPGSYYEVGDRCLLVNPFLEGTWDEARYYCHTLGSEFVEIETFQFFLDLLNFLRDEGLDEHSYWLGARDEEVEGEWRWELGGGILPMGSPFWALEFYSGDTYNIEPLGSNYSNCLRLDHMRYLYLDDKDCTSLNSFMCQQLP